MSIEQGIKLDDVRCSHCGSKQISSPTCLSCGRALDSNTATEKIPQPNSETAEIRLVHRVYFYGSSKSLFEIQTVNVFFILITLGLYYFWAKARVRSYLLGQTEFLEDRFAYHGTGKEQLIGFLKAGLLFGGLSLFLRLAPFLPGGRRVQILFSVVGYILFLGLIAVARVGARRYRLSRISWRNVRFSFRGKVAEFTRLYVIGFLLSIFTLGLYYPFFRYKQDAYMISHTYFGNRSLKFDGQVKDLYKIYFQSALFLIAYLLIIIPAMWFLGLVMAAINIRPSSPIVSVVGFVGLTLILTASFGIPWSFLVTEQQQYFWKHVSFGTARFILAVTFGSFLRLKIGNIILFIFTFGLAWPWIAARNIRFLLDRLSLEGDLNINSIQQDAQVSFPFGDEFDTLLDLDLGSGIG